MSNVYFFAVPAKVVWGIPGKDIELPCDVTPPVPSDAVKMVFWFKDSTMPIYRLVPKNLFIRAVIVIRKFPPMIIIQQIVLAYFWIFATASLSLNQQSQRI